MARKLVDDKLSELYVSARLAQCQQDAADTADYDTMANPPLSTFSPGAESNPDSCYDSDASSSGSRRNSTPYLEVGGHDNVSRTTSDTLAAEHAEYTELEPVIKADQLSVEIPTTMDTQTSLTPASSSTPPRRKVSAHKSDPAVASDLMSNQEYAAKVEYALRLGYSESQTRAALCKVGYRASEDTLLGELVQASQDTASDSGSDGDSVTLEVPDVYDQRTREETATPATDEDNLRNIVIDGSNVAMSHGAKDVFSCRGIKLAVDWFKERGHKEIIVFVPTWRKEASRPDTQITDQEILKDLESAGCLVFTPARRVPGGKRITCYDDRYIIKLAAETGGIVVSNDNYRDLAAESAEFKRVIEERLLMYSFVNDRFMPPDDPLGRHGPSLEDFLRKTPVGNKSQAPICPYNKKCTFGNKCKYYHPERGSVPLKFVSERLIEQGQFMIKEVKERGKLQGDVKTRGNNAEGPSGKKSLMRTQSAAPGMQKSALTRTQSGVQKTSLTRTQSAHPGLQQKSPLTRTKSVTAATVIANQEPDLGLPPSQAEHGDVQIFVPPDVKSREYHVYNDRLSKLRVRVEQADLQQEQTQDNQIKRQKAPDAASSATGAKHKSDPVVKPKTHWSLMHESLRATHSDPLKGFNYDPDNPITGGHLALAKKLSDEGRDEPFQSTKLLGRGLSPNRQSPLVLEESSQAPSRPKASFPNAQSVIQGGAGKHQKLQRQLSLKGADDPRLQQGSNWYKPMPRIQGEESESSHWAKSPHEPLDKHLSFPLPGRDKTNVDQRMQQLAIEESKSHEPFQVGELPRTSKFPNDSLQVHQPVQRMGSAPVMHGGEARTPAVRFHGTPKMSRQNSTSDPQLNAFNPEAGPGAWAYPADLHRDMVLRSLQAGAVMPQHFYTAPSSPLSPHFSHGAFKVHFGPPAAGLQPNTNFPMPHSFPNMAALTSQQSAATTFAPTHSTLRGPSPGYYVARPPDSPVPMMVSPGPDMTRAVSPSPHCPTEHISLTARSSYPSGLTAQARQPANQEPALVSHDLADPANPRYDLYYHLCHLFKEDEVRRVLTEHPNETDPQKLCKYLI